MGDTGKSRSRRPVTPPAADDLLLRPRLFVVEGNYRVVMRGGVFTNTMGGPPEAVAIRRLPSPWREVAIEQAFSQAGGVIFYDGSEPQLHISIEYAGGGGLEGVCAPFEWSSLLVNLPSGWIKGRFRGTPDGSGVEFALAGVENAVVVPARYGGGEVQGYGVQWESVTIRILLWGESARS